MRLACNKARNSGQWPAPAPAGGSVPPTQFPKPRLISKVSWLLGSAASCGLRGYFAQGAQSKIRKLSVHPYCIPRITATVKIKAKHFSPPPLSPNIKKKKKKKTTHRHAQPHS